MDWIRRNWPDLLIGIALVAVIAGIIATLLTGGSFFPLGQSDQTSGRAQSSSSAGPVAGQLQASPAPAARDQDGSTGTGRNSGTAPVPVGSQRPFEVTALPLPGDGAGEQTAGSSRSAGTASVAPVGNGSADVGGAGATSSGDAAPTRSAAPSNSPAPSTSASSTSASPADPRDDAGQRAVADDAATDGAAGGLYRISVGAFSAPKNAERQASIFRDAGYPVFIGTQGELSIVLVGPYGDQSEAERVADRIRAGKFGIEPVIYRFRAERSREEPSRSPTAASTTSAPAPQPTAAQAGGSRYLQVGAYATAESSLPQRERLEGLGFRVTERAEGSLLKLLVGPFAGQELASARTLLTEQGIEHFPR
jgi:cell division septation protein DedD